MPKVHYKFSRPIQYISPVMEVYCEDWYAGFFTADWTIQQIEDWLPGILEKFYNI